MLPPYWLIICTYSGMTEEAPWSTIGKPGSCSETFSRMSKRRCGFALELERAVAGADGDGQRVNAGRLHEFLNLVGIGVKRVVVADFHVVLNAGQTAQLALDHNAVIVRILDHLTWSA